MTAVHFAELMATPAGRLARIALGLVLAVLAFYVGGLAGAILGVVAVVPLAAGAFNVCFIAPLLHVPFRAAKLAAH